ncbi:MAG: hypothetical protein KAI24_25450 [Planctomycetes bacterium]|nr:hypothetical protein [Planctomycetota bacterium]
MLIPAALCVAAATTAQVAPSAALVSAQAFAGASTAAVPPAGADVWPGLSRGAAGAVGASSFTLVHVVDDLQIDLQWHLETQAWQNGPSTALVEARFVFTSPLTQVGELSVEWAPQTSGTGIAALAVDIYDDGYVDATGPFVTPTLFHSAPLTVRVRAEVHADAGTIQGPWGSSWSWNGAALADLRIRFVPTHAVASLAAASTCVGGPALHAHPDLSGGVRLDALAAPGDDLLVFVLGFAPTALPLPWSNGCTLLVDPVVTDGVLLPGGAAASRAIAVPPAVRPAAFLAQVVTLDADALAIRAGDAVLVDVP